MKARTILLTILFALLILPVGCASGEEMPVVTDVPLDMPLEVPVDEPTTEALGDIPEDVTLKAQALLIDMGLMEGEADGKYGSVTAEAVRQFQAQNDLVQTGLLDEATLERLEEISKSGQSVRSVQQRLHDLGYLYANADGKFGAQSTAAMTLFQQINGLNPTGLMDETSLQRLFSDEARSIPGELRPGDKGEAVTAMQRRLIQFGFTTDEPDGAYGSKTIAAVLAFQKHLAEQGLAEQYGIAPDGNATTMTQFLLFDDGYSSYLRSVTPGVPDSEGLRVERRLYALGYMDVVPDEIVDDYTLSALKLFNEKAGLDDTGFSREAIDALFSDAAPVADHCVPHDIAAGDTGIAVRDAEEALVRCGMTIKIPNGKYDEDLETAVGRLYSYLQSTGYARSGMFSDPSALSITAQLALTTDELPGYRVTVDGSASETETLRVQRRLHTLFYLARTDVDGQFGENTRAAIEAFQEDNHLEKTGTADQATQELLFSREVQPKPLPYRVEVSLERQRVKVYHRESDGNYTLVQTFICSTGLGNSTPKGIFLDGFPVNRWHYFEKFHCWAQYSFDIEGDIMFHSVLYSSNSERSLRSGSVYALGSKASHGCIRLKVADARFLFEHCPRGSLAILIY